MTLFGDVELSTLREKATWRGMINTYLAHDGWKDRWWAFVRERLDEGRQAFVVAPRVVNRPMTPPTGDEDISSVESVYRELAEQFADYEVGLLHGRMSNDEKQSMMQAFASGRLQVLVSTTVIEVGIDVPNATVMTILGAQRFGLAQLHQLRGRVSRGTMPATCVSLPMGRSRRKKMSDSKIFEQTDDGFELAEADFRMRGPGDLMAGNGKAACHPCESPTWSGIFNILTVAREIAQSMIDEDPELTADELAELRAQVMRRYGKRLTLGDVA